MFKRLRNPFRRMTLAEKSAVETNALVAEINKRTKDKLPKSDLAPPGSEDWASAYDRKHLTFGCF